ncbi:MAG: aldo/keto reductase [Galactobacter sp.]|uniref:aldo/keto reductase n=1 Tax=Galactobacter sp. TaxID=2676125 RepID=UPI0025C2A1CC|nr:aldo/keto reductase [Galactobacter sp.]
MTNLDFGGFVLGTNVFGWTADQDTSFRILDAFVDQGGKAVDTADSYSLWVPGNSGGESETIIGNWLTSRGRRDDITLATKVAMDPNRKGLSPANIKTTVEESLRRLQTDHIDLYYAHRDDPEVPQEEMLAAFHELVTEGKVRELGASTFSGERLRSADTIARANGLTPFTVSQDKYNLVERGAEQEALPVINELGLVEIPYVSLASGFLTGKYRPGVEVASQRAGGAAAYLEDERTVALLSVLDDVASAHSVSVTAVSLAWLRSRTGVAAPLASARTVEQLGSLFESVSLTLTAEEIAALNAASAHRVVPAQI